jgi:hypothetical protein
MLSKTQKPDLLKKSIQGSLNTSGTGTSMLPQAIKPQGNNNQLNKILSQGPMVSVQSQNAILYAQ